MTSFSFEKKVEKKRSMRTRKSVKQTDPPGTYRERGYKKRRTDYGAKVVALRSAPVPRLNVRTGGLLGMELKYFDAHKPFVVTTNTWAGGELDPAANCLGCPTQGSGASNRDGSRIVVKSIQINGTVQRYVGQDKADTRAGSVVQLALVMDTQANGATLNAEDVYSATDPEVPAQRVIANTSRFKVLRTQCFSLYDTCAFSDGANTGSVTGNCHHFTWYIRMNQVMNFIDGAGAGNIADIKDVAFHMIGCSESATSADYITYNFRMRYIG